MSTLIEPYREDRIAAIREFNARLDRGGAPEEFRFPESPMPGWESFLAVENGAVRGGFALRQQEFSFAGEIRRVAHYRLPVSEGIVSKEYAAVGVQMLRRALQIEPLLYALGMGGEDRPLPRMLKAMGWSLFPVPFYFKARRPFRFLRGIRALRQSAGRRILLDAAALSGAGPLAIRILQRRKGLAAEAEPFEDFGPWADELWERCHRWHSMIAVRDSATLRLQYPPGAGRFIKIRCAGGWAVLLDTPMRGHRQFGDLRVGTIADCLARPENAAAVISAATRELERRSVDLIVSNQTHAAWCGALEASGFLRGPSNYIFAASPKLAAVLKPPEIHINRGDGDGPIHL